MCTSRSKPPSKYEIFDNVLVLYITMLIERTSTPTKAVSPYCCHKEVDK